MYHGDGAHWIGAEWRDHFTSFRDASLVGLWLMAMASSTRVGMSLS